MSVLGGILMFVGVIIGVVGGVWLLIEAFKQSIWWGLGCFFISIVSLIFVIVHFEVAKKPFFVSLAGTVLIILGAIMMPGASTAR
jgi:uncharacterized membrane protein